MQKYDMVNFLDNIRISESISTNKSNLIAMLCIAILILLRDVSGVAVERVVFIGIATIACLLTNKAGIYCLLAFLAPLAPGISATYITAIALVILFVKQSKLHIQPIGLICMILLLLIELLSAFRGQFSIVEYLRFTGIFVFSFFCMLDLENDYNFKGMLQSYLFGFLTAMISILGQLFQQYSITQVLSLGVRLGDTRQILNLSSEGMLVSYNPNGLGFVCLLAALFSLLLYQEDKKKHYLFFFGGATISGIMTQSRSFLIIYTLSIVLYVLFSCHSLKSAVKSIVMLVVGGGAIIGSAFWLIPEYIDSIFLRFQDEDLLNGRGSIMSDYFQEMYQHVDRAVFGVGLQNYQDKYGLYMSAHNATQEVIITWGIIGLMIVFILFASIFYNAYRHNPKAKYVQYLPIIMYLAAIQSGQGFSATGGMLLVMVAYSAILLPLKEGEYRLCKKTKKI